MKYFFKLFLLFILLLFIKIAILGKSLLELKIENDFKFLINKYWYDKKDIVSQINATCVFNIMGECSKKISFSNIKIDNKWDKLYIFPKSLGNLDTGISLINKKDREPFDLLVFVYMHNDKVIDEGYQKTYFYESFEQTVDFNIKDSGNLSKNQNKTRYYICNHLSSLNLTKTRFNDIKTIELNNCKLMIMPDSALLQLLMKDTENALRGQ